MNRVYVFLAACVAVAAIGCMAEPTQMSSSTSSDDNLSSSVTTMESNSSSDLLSTETLVSLSLPNMT